MTTTQDPLYTGYRYPAEIISYAVWLYFRFPLSLRMVEEMLAACGITVTHETIRQGRCGTENFKSEVWDHDPDACAMLRDRLVSRRSIIGTIGCHLFNVSLYLIKQQPHLGRVSYFFLSECLSYDQDAGGVNGEMQSAPEPFTVPDPRRCGILTRLGCFG